MAKVKWETIVSSVAATAIESFCAAPERRRILSALASKGKDGVSFSALKKELDENPASLNLHLTALMQGGLVENFLQRSDESREYSFYRVASIGGILLAEYDVFATAVQRQIGSSSNRLYEEMANLALLTKPPIREFPRVLGDIEFLEVCRTKGFCGQHSGMMPIGGIGE
jgi:DNA-binding transcriptional ArsR family regulator